MEGWVHTSLGDIAVIQSGVGFPKEYQGGTDGDFPFAKVSDMNLPGNERSIHTSKNWITDEVRQSLRAKVFPEGSVVFPKIGAAIATNKKRLVATPCCVDNNVIGLIPNVSKVIPEFLYYWLLQIDLSDLANDSGLPSIRKTTIENFHLLVPESLPEQERIVAILDEAFAAIATASANAEKNLANARELFDAFLLENLESQEKQWPRHTLAELLERGWIVHHMDGNHGGDYPRKHEFIDEGIPYISAKCIVGDNVDMSKAKYLSPDRAAQLRKGFAQAGDVLFAHNATVGPVAILKTQCPTVILGTSLTYYRCNAEFISSEYLAHYMRSSDFVRQYDLVMRQSTRNQVPITKQRTFTHVIPPTEVQREIAMKLDNLRSQIAIVENISSAKAEALTELKQSILHKAFTGELTADEKSTDRTLSEAGL